MYNVFKSQAQIILGYIHSISATVS